MKKETKKETNIVLEVLKKVGSYILALYVLGVALVSQVLIIGNVISPAMAKFNETEFMSARLVPWFDFVFSPIRVMASSLPSMSIAFLAMSAYWFLLKKSKWFNNREIAFFLILGAFFIAVS